MDAVGACNGHKWTQECSGHSECRHREWSGNAVEWECSGVNAFMQWMQLGDPHNDLSPSSRCTVDAVDTVGGHSGCNEYSGCSGHRNAVDNAQGMQLTQWVGTVHAVDAVDAVDTVDMQWTVYAVDAVDAVDTVGGNSQCNGCWTQWTQECSGQCECNGHRGCIESECSECKECSGCSGYNLCNG